MWQGIIREVQNRLDVRLRLGLGQRVIYLGRKESSELHDATSCLDDAPDEIFGCKVEAVDRESYLAFGDSGDLLVPSNF